MTWPDTSLELSPLPSTPVNRKLSPEYPTLKDKRKSVKEVSNIGNLSLSPIKNVESRLFKSTGVADITKKPCLEKPSNTFTKKTPEWWAHNSKRVLCQRENLVETGVKLDQLLWKIGLETSPMMSSAEITCLLGELRPIIWSLKRLNEESLSTGGSQAWESLTERGKRLASMHTPSYLQQNSGTATGDMKMSLLTSSEEPLRYPIYSDGSINTPLSSKSKVARLYSKPSRFGLLLICTLISGIQLWMSLQRMP